MTTAASNTTIARVIPTTPPVLSPPLLPPPLGELPLPVVDVELDDPEEPEDDGHETGSFVDGRIKNLLLKLQVP